MVIAILLTIFAFLIGTIIWAVITFFKNPDSVALTFIFDYRYRLLLQIRRDYLSGRKCNPPTGYEFFYSRAMDYINNETNIRKSLRVRQDIANMLAYEGYIYHYFVECGDFTVSVYRRMWDDYRSGTYAIINYPCQEKLRKMLPLEISTNEGAFTDFWKFVEAGWFDKNTGMFILGEKFSPENDTQATESGARNYQYIGRAIYYICKRNSIPSPEKVFAPLWRIEPKKIKEWLRTNENETITIQIDNIVKSIISRK